MYTIIKSSFIALLYFSERALQGNITLTELVESTLIVGAVTVLDSESPALIRRALLEDRVKQSPAIQTRGRSRTWTGTELSRDYSRPPKRPSPLTTPTLKTPERALPANITITRLVERTLSVGSVSVLDDESPARMRRAILEDKAKRSPVIERRSRSVTWAGTELPQDWPRQAPSLSPILKPTMKALGSPVIQKRRQSEMDRNGIVPRFTKTSAEFTTINLDNNNPSRKDATEVTSSDTKASDLVNDYSEVTFF
ncbi:hypothetical protein DPMN_000980 [Dreissena polymorpha]|uniref:Uncharacterized protein n=1 Tax=Dreissena polymorpha TaxID=45954 RepID=A0A9D4RSD4_DREPO|nr:hypothetical protein DPMN_000980 [Dreissena polymorpha]